MLVLLRKSAGQGVTFQPWARNAAMARGMCQAEVSSSQGRVLSTPGSCAVCSAFSKVVREADS